MRNKNFDSLSEMLLECGGEYGLYHSKRIIEIVSGIAEGRIYNKDVIEFCAYTHDLGGYSKYVNENVDHAIRSSEIVGELIEQFDFSQEEKNIIIETILNHHKSVPLKSIESILFRDADALDFLGVIGITRDIARVSKDIKKGIKSIQAHRKNLESILFFESSKKIAEERINEMDIFLDRFFVESFNYY